MAADWGSYYGPGGQSATYVSNMGSPSGHGGHGGRHGRGSSLSGQIEGFMGDFPDPNESLNALLGYIEQLKAAERVRAEKERIRASQEEARQRQAAMMAQNAQQQAAYMAQLQGGTPQGNFMKTANMLDSMTETTPFNIGATNKAFQNFPAASALVYGKSVFPDNPWVDLYKVAAGQPSASAIQTAGENWRHITPSPNMPQNRRT